MRTENLVCISDAFRLIDFSIDRFVKESFLMMYLSQGGLTYSDLINMSFKEYQEFKKEAVELQNAMNPKKEEQDGG